MAIGVIIPIGDFRVQAMILSRDVQNMADEFENMREPLNDSVDKVIMPSITTNFDHGGRPTWEPLAASTIRKRGTALPILDETGILRSVATSKRIWNIDNSQAVMNLDNPEYAKFHQTGTDKMPQRTFAILQEEDMDKIEDIFDEWINRIATTRGRWPG